jgi:hypothetical protein
MKILLLLLFLPFAAFAQGTPASKSESEFYMILFIAAILGYIILYWIIRSATRTDHNIKLQEENNRLLRLIAAHLEPETVNIIRTGTDESVNDPEVLKKIISDAKREEENRQWRENNAKEL